MKAQMPNRAEKKVERVTKMDKAYNYEMKVKRQEAEKKKQAAV